MALSVMGGAFLVGRKAHNGLLQVLVIDREACYFCVFGAVAAPEGKFLYVAFGALH